MCFPVAFISERTLLPFLTGTHCPSDRKKPDEASLHVSHMTCMELLQGIEERRGEETREEVKGSGGLEKTSDSQNYVHESSDPVSQCPKLHKFFQFFPLCSQVVSYENTRDYNILSFSHLHVCFIPHGWLTVRRLSGSSELELAGYLYMCVCVDACGCS